MLYFINYRELLLVSNVQVFQDGLSVMSIVEPVAGGLIHGDLSPSLLLDATKALT